MQSTPQLQQWLLNQAKAVGVPRAQTKVLNPNKVRLVISTPDVKAYLDISRYMPNPMHVVYSFDVNLEDQKDADLGVGAFARFDEYRNATSKSADSRASFLQDISEVRRSVTAFGDEQYKKARDDKNEDELDRSKRIRAVCRQICDLVSSVASSITFVDILGT